VPASLSALHRAGVGAASAFSCVVVFPELDRLPKVAKYVRQRVWGA